MVEAIVSTGKSKSRVKYPPKIHSRLVFYQGDFPQIPIFSGNIQSLSHFLSNFMRNFGSMMDYSRD
jgi:hypothetical protein